MSAASLSPRLSEPREATAVRAGDHVEVECYDVDGGSQGDAVYRILALYPPSARGQFGRAEFLFCSDQYLQWYGTVRGAGGGGRRAAT